MLAVCSHAAHEAFSLVDNRARPFTSPVKWHLHNLTPDMDKYQVILAFTRAFQTWQAALDPARLVFGSTSTPAEAQIHLHFATSRTAPSPFGPGVLAYAGPNDGGKGFMYLNEAINWGEMHSAGKFELFKVVVHELGHILNANHSTDRADIMYPTYSSSQEVVITDATKRGILNFYGLSSPEVPMEIGDVLRRMFPDRTALTRLRFTQLRALADYLGISQLLKLPTQLVVAVDRAL